MKAMLIVVATLVASSLTAGEPKPPATLTGTVDERGGYLVLGVPAARSGDDFSVPAQTDYRLIVSAPAHAKLIAGRKGKEMTLAVQGTYTDAHSGIVFAVVSVPNLK